MSDNLKVAKECGATENAMSADGAWNICMTEEAFEAYTSRILASQQTARETEIARLKEENVRQHKEILVYHESRLALIHEKEAMAKQLSASQAREAELREKLEAAEARGDAYSARAFKAEQEYQTILEHCRTLEARIKASQEQEPEFVDFEVYGYASDNARNESWCKEKDWSRTEFLNIIGEDWAQKNTIRNVVFHHYSAPIIPPELAELQRELDRWKNSALTPREESMQRENAELRKLLEEIKVPEDVLFRVVEVAHMAGQRNQGHCDPSAYEALVYWNTYKLQILDLLGVKPQPKEPKQ